MSNFQSNYSSPIRGIGAKWQDAAAGSAEIRIVGSGIVGTLVGLPGGPTSRVSATLIGTGLYSLVFPSTRHVEFYPAVECPTGQSYIAHTTRTVGVSGTAQLQVLQAGYSAASGLPASGLPNLGVGAPANPPTGTVIKLLTFSYPVTQF